MYIPSKRIRCDPIVFLIVQFYLYFDHIFYTFYCVEVEWQMGKKNNHRILKII